MSCDCENDVGTFDFPDAYSGLSLVGFDIELTEDSGLPDLVSCEIKFYAAGDTEKATALLTLASGSQLTLTSASDPWTIRVENITTITLPKGIYFFEFSATDAEGINDVYLTGGWKVK